MSDLTQKLQKVAIYHWSESGIEDPRAVKIFYDRVKTQYYRLSDEEKKTFLEAFPK